MSLNNLNKYNFHDSLLVGINFSKEQNKLTLTIDFCYWMQDDYKDEDPDTGIIKLVFANVSCLSELPQSIHDDSILSLIVSGDYVDIVLSDDLKMREYIIKLKASDCKLITV